MILRMYTLSLEPEHPLRFSLDELRSYLNQNLAEYTLIHKENTAGALYRYPAIQCKRVKNMLMLTGISQGAGCLCQLARGPAMLSLGK